MVGARESLAGAGEGRRRLNSRTRPALLVKVYSLQGGQPQSTSTYFFLYAAWES